MPHLSPSQPAASHTLPPPALPPLSPDQRSILATYRASGYSLDAAPDPIALAESLADPALILWIDHLRHLDALAREHAEASDRAAARAALRDLLDHTPDPVERRRAAGAILRSPAVPARGPRSFHALHPSRRRDLTRPPATPRHADLPPPTRVPSPADTPPDIARSIALAFSQGERASPGAGLATLAAYLAPDATLDTLPLDQDSLFDLAARSNTLEIFRRAVQFWAPEPPAIDADNARVFLDFVTSDDFKPLAPIARSRDRPHGPFHITFHLARLADPRLPGHWLLTRIESS